MKDNNQSYPRNLPADELICLPFLDTDTTRDAAIADAELSARGYPHWLVAFFRKIAKIGLWYQVFAWEWASFGAYDVLLGYVPIGLVLSLLLALLHQYFAAGVVLGLSLALLLAAIVGMLIRRRRWEKDIS